MKYLDYPLLNELSSSLSSDPTADFRVDVRFEAYSVKPVGKEKRAFKEREAAYMSEQEGMEEMSFSPEMREAGLSSCFGRLDERESRKAHFLLVSTLNSAFPDHDFSSLRPDHFTRETSAAHVLTIIHGSLPALSGAGGHLPLTTTVSGFGQASHSPQSYSLSHSSSPRLSHLFTNSPPVTGLWVPGSSPQRVATPKPELYRVLNDIISLDDCEVYSWFPEPEYDPHLEEPVVCKEEGSLYSDNDVPATGTKMDVSQEGYVDGNGDWGEIGMDLESMDIEMEEAPSSNQRSSPQPRTLHVRPSEFEQTLPRQSVGVHDTAWGNSWERQGDGLLWSANYFFYSKRQKRILFLTCWCRHRSRTFDSSNPSLELQDLPLPSMASISDHSSFEPSSPLSLGSSIRNHRYHHHNHHHHQPRNIPLSSHPRTAKETSTIPIRGMTEPEHRNSPVSNFISEVWPKTTAPNPGPRVPAAPGAGQTHSPMARMTAGGFRPKQSLTRLDHNPKASLKVHQQLKHNLLGEHKRIIQDQNEPSDEGVVITHNRRREKTLSASMP